MSEQITIANKTTTGAPDVSQLAINEMCWVTPDKQMYIRDASGVIPLNNLTVTGTTPPNDNDGRPDGTIYIQTTS